MFRRRSLFNKKQDSGQGRMSVAMPVVVGFTPTENDGACFYAAGPAVRNLMLLIIRNI